MSTENEDLNDDVEVATDDDFEVTIDESDDEEGLEAESDAPEEEEAAPVEEEAAPEEAAAEEEQPVEEEPEDNTPKGRWAREKRLRERIIAERDQILTERDQIRHAAIQVAEVAQRNEQLVRQRDEEVVALRRQNAELQKHFAETLDYAYERDIAINAQALRRAREDGNYDEEIKIQGQLDRLRFEQNQIRQAKANIPAAEVYASQQAAPQQQEPVQAAPQQQPQRPPPPKRAVEWLEANKTWFADEKFASHRAFVLAEDTKLVREGYDKNSAEYYKELDRRVDEAFPSLRKKRVARGTVAPAGASASRSGSRNRVVLNKTDLSTMRRFGLDPSNKEHLREYARSKRAA